MSLHATTSQTVGPFFAIGLAWLDGDELAGPGVSGERVAIAGRVLDGDGAPVPDALIEVWQANAHGRYAHPEDAQDKPLEPAFSGFGRIPTDALGRFRFGSVKPGPVPGPGGSLQAPHVLVSLFTRGLLVRLVREVDPGDEPANAHDFALGLVEPQRRETLIAKPTSQAGCLEWNVVLQGPGETVFFDC